MSRPLKLERSSITGTTRVVFVVAYPCEHVRTPTLFNNAIHAQGLDAVVVPAKVPPSGLAAFITAFRGMENAAGMVVSVPHKLAVTGLIDELQGAALQSSVCNVVRRQADGRLIGCSLDGSGFVKGLQDEGIEPRGARVVLYGAGGGVGTALAYALCDAGVGALHLVNRTAAKATLVIGRLRLLYPSIEIVAGWGRAAGADMAINATSLGMRAGDDLAFDPTQLPPGAVVADVVMQPDVTPLLHRAAGIGLRIQQGVHMLQAQIPLLVDFILRERNVAGRQ